MEDSRDFCYFLSKKVSWSIEQKNMYKLLLFILISGIILITPWAIISLSVQDSLYKGIEDIPNREVGVVLGTTP